MSKNPKPFRLKMVWCGFLILFFSGLGIGNSIPSWGISFPLSNGQPYTIPFTAILFFIVLIGVAVYSSKLISNTHKNCVWCHKEIDLKTPKNKIPLPMRSENDAWLHRECYQVIVASREETKQ